MYAPSRLTPVDQTVPQVRLNFAHSIFLLILWLINDRLKSTALNLLFFLYLLFPDGPLILGLPKKIIIYRDRSSSDHRVGIDELPIGVLLPKRCQDLDVHPQGVKLRLEI